MKVLIIVFLAACSSIKNPDKSGDGVLDRAMRDENCGLMDKFYDGCREKEASQEETLSQQ